jgi:hypothetical protein
MRDREFDNEDLRTARLSLRRPTRADVDAIYSIHSYEHATAVVGWATTHIPDHPLVARVRPRDAASLGVAARTGLRRAEHLDSPGEGLTGSSRRTGPTVRPGVADPRSEER